MRKSCWARSLAAVVFVGALFFGFAEAEAVQLADGTVVDGDYIAENGVLGDVEVGQDDPNVPATVDFMPGAITAGTISVGNSGTVNMYGGAFDSLFGAAFEGWAEIVLAADADVTFYGTSFSVGGVAIDEGIESVDVTTYTPNEDWVEFGSVTYGVTWEDELGHSYDIWVGADAGTFVTLSWLGAPDPEPEIDVDVEELSYDFGDVVIGEPNTFVIPIYNLGDGDLTVTSVSLVGDGDFVITDIPAEPIVIVPSELEGVDIEVTFTPSAEGLVSVIVVIASDDADESVVEVILDGCGIVVVVPPEQQIQNILDFYDESVDNGTIIGNAPGRSCRISRAERRVRVLRNMIKSAGDMINLNLNCLAVRQLKSVAKKTDGERRPPDFVVGDSVAELNTMVNELIADLTL